MSIGNRIAELRRSHNLTQADLATAIGKDASAVSRLERGERKVSSYELGLIAHALGVSVNGILGVGTAPPAMTLAARVEDAISSDEAKAALVNVRYMFEVEAILDQIGVPDSPRPSVAFAREEADPVSAGRRMAEEARGFVGLGDGPFGPNLPGTIESHFGVDVMILPLPRGFAGACVLAGDRAVIVARKGDRAGRQRFTLAHELGHHLFGDPDSVFVEDDRRMYSNDDPGEERANAFAANFLAPTQWLVRHVGGRTIDPALALELALEAGMSYMSTVYHLHNTGLLAGSQHRDDLLAERPSRVAQRLGRAEDWAEAQRGFRAARPAGLVVRRAQAAYQSGAIGIRPLADVMLRDDSEQLRSDLARGGIAPSLA